MLLNLLSPSLQIPGMPPAMQPMAAVPADGATNPVIAGPIANLLEANFTILNDVS